MKKFHLTPIENFRRMMRGLDPERLPLDITLTPPVADRLEARRGTRDPVAGLGSDVCQLEPAGNGVAPGVWRDAYRDAGIRLPEDAEIDSTGIVQISPKRGTGEAYHFRELVHALTDVETVEELERLPWGPEETFGPDPERIAAVAEARRQHLVLRGVRECTVFENAWYLRGMDQLFCDLMEDDPVGNWLLDRFTRRSMAEGIEFCRRGVDVIALGDDIGMQTGMMMSVPFWRQHLKPRLHRVIQAIRDHGGDRILISYHSDGDIRDVVPDLLELGVDILNPVQPECMEVDTILRTYKDDCAFWGMLGTQSTFPHGSPEDVRTALRELASLAREGCRIVAAPTHVLEPDVPWENIEALDEVFHLPLASG